MSKNSKNGEQNCDVADRMNEKYYSNTLELTRSSYQSVWWASFPHIKRFIYHYLLHWFVRLVKETTGSQRTSIKSLTDLMTRMRRSKRKIRKMRNIRSSFESMGKEPESAAMSTINPKNDASNTKKSNVFQGSEKYLWIEKKRIWLFKRC